MMNWSMTFLAAALTAAAVSYTSPTDLVGGFARMVFLLAMLMAGVTFLLAALKSLRTQASA